jgi:hypothetical protein
VVQFVVVQGAVALSVELLDLKLLFISSHLAAHGDQVQRRNDDCQRIRAGLFATTTTTTPTPRATGERSTTGRSPRARGSMEIPRSLPMSAPAARAATSDGGGKPLVEGIGALSDRTGSIPWGGFMRSNRVMDSSAYEEANRSPASAARKQVCKCTYFWRGKRLDKQHAVQRPVRSTTAVLFDNLTPHI